MGNSCETITSLFQQDFFCKEEIKNGCIVLRNEIQGVLTDPPFVLPLQMFKYILSETNLCLIYNSLIKNNSSHEPIIVQNWKTETFLIIAFEWDDCNANICFTYTNFPLKIGYGKWKTEALKFIESTSTFFPPPNQR